MTLGDKFGHILGYAVFLAGVGVGIVILGCFYVGGAAMILPYAITWPFNETFIAAFSVYAIAVAAITQYFVVGRWWREIPISKQLAQASEYVYLLLGFIGLVAILDVFPLAQGDEASGDEDFAHMRMGMATHLIDRDLKYCAAQSAAGAASPGVLKACDWVKSVDLLLDTNFSDRGWSKLTERRTAPGFEDGIKDIDFKDPNDSSLVYLKDDLSDIQMYVEHYTYNMKKSHDIKIAPRPLFVIVFKFIGPFAIVYAISIRLARHTAELLDILRDAAPLVVPESRDSKPS